MIFTAGYGMLLLSFIIGCIFDSDYRKNKDILLSVNGYNSYSYYSHEKKSVGGRK